MKRDPLPPDDHRHGTINAYSNYDCRCEPCRKAWAQYMAGKRNEPKAALAPGDSRHGTISGYKYWKCRCAECRKLAAAVRQRQYQARKRGLV